MYIVTFTAQQQRKIVRTPLFEAGDGATPLHDRIDSLIEEFAYRFKIIIYWVRCPS